MIDLWAVHEMAMASAEPNEIPFFTTSYLAEFMWISSSKGSAKLTCLVTVSSDESHKMALETMTLSDPLAGLAPLPKHLPSCHDNDNSFCACRPIDNRSYDTALGQERWFAALPERLD